MRFVSAVLNCRWPGVDPSPEEQRRNPQVQKSIRSPFVQRNILHDHLLWIFLITLRTNIYHKITSVWKNMKWDKLSRKIIINMTFCNKYFVTLLDNDLCSPGELFSTQTFHRTVWTPLAPLRIRKKENSRSVEVMDCDLENYCYNAMHGWKFECL